MKVLWISINCLLDSSSGASLAIGSILKKLTRLGWNVEAVGCTTFDNLSAIDLSMETALDKISNKSVFEIYYSDVKHTLIKTSKFLPNEISHDDINGFFSLYIKKLLQFKPDLVFYYGGGAIDLLIPIEAKKHNAKTVFYIANSKYIHHSRWADDVSLIITDTAATAQLYNEKLGLNITPIGSMIEKEKVISTQHSRENVLFINPAPHKGGRLVAQLVLHMMERRPEIIFEIVDSTSSWNKSLDYVLTKKNINCKKPSNVVLHENKKDMREVYGMARILLQPSLYWESGSRVIAEAAMNGIPSMVTPVGGQVEMMGQGGVVLEFSKFNYVEPYTDLLNENHLKKWGDCIIELFDNQDLYNDLSKKALNSSKSLHDLDSNILKLKKLLENI